MPMDKISNKLLIENASQVLTMRGESNHDVGMLRDASIYVEDGLIRSLGSKVFP